MHVEINIKIIGDENETAEQLMGRVAGLIRDQPSILVEHGNAPEDQNPRAVADEVAAEEPAPPAKKRGRPAKADKAAAAEVKAAPKKEAVLEKADDDDDDDDFNFGDETEDEDEAESVEATDEDEDEEPAPKKQSKDKGEAKAKKGPAVTLEGNIIPAFRKFTSVHGNSAGAEILKKFGVQSVRDLNPEDYEAVIAAIDGYKQPKKKK